MAIDFDITIHHPGTAAEARADAVAALIEGLAIINEATGGKGERDGSDPYTAADIQAATAQQLINGLGILASAYIEALGTARKKRSAADTARSAEPGSRIDKPRSL